MDFYKINVNKFRRGNWDYKVKPTFDYLRNNDIICKGGEMYAFWDKSKKQWNTSIIDLIDYIDTDVLAEVEKIQAVDPSAAINALYMHDSSSGVMNEFKNYTENMVQSEIIFNNKIIFKSDPYHKKDYSTLRLEYDPAAGSTEAFDTLLDTLYSPKEKEKILWFMGLVLTGNTSKVQKFMFIHGGKGTGKGTVIKIFKQVFKDYYAPITLKKLTSDSQFATEGVREIPLLVDEDCDMSAIKDDTNLLKLTAHEPISVNRKYMKPYITTFNGLLITASNRAYKVRDIDSGIMRRVVTVYSSSKTFKFNVYNELMSRIKFEIPAIAQKAIDIFNELGLDYYNAYEDKEMAAATDYFLDFMRTKYEAIKEVLDEHEGCIAASTLSNFYYDYLLDNEWQTAGYKSKVRNQAKRYFSKTYDRKKINGKQYRNVFEGILLDKMFDAVDIPVEEVDVNTDGWIKLKKQHSVFNEACSNYPAQYANSKGTPTAPWSRCVTILEDVDTHQLHYIRVPSNHIVIDFDLKENGEKSLELNLKEANKFPPTYCEVSKSGQGLHLHYIYDGDVNKLSSIYDDHIEIKKYTGKASLRRQLTLCNDLDISHISTGLPLKEEVNKLYDDVKGFVQNEKGMRTTIIRAMRKEYDPPYTTPNMNLIDKVFKDAQANGVKYDLRDLAHDISVFASNSSNQKEYCMNLANNIVYSTIDDVGLNGVPEFVMIDKRSDALILPKEELTLFDCEVFPNMNYIGFKKYGGEYQEYFNPTPMQIEELLKSHLVGFNNLKYDNHILYAILVGKSPKEVYDVSKRIIKPGKGRRSLSFPLATDFSYTDLYDLSSDKKSLKKWEIEMEEAGVEGVTYDEFEFDFDNDLPEEYWERCAEYCRHDVVATEKLLDYIEYDYNTRKMLASLSGLTMNHTNNQHTARILFGDDPHPETKFNYVDLSTIFPRYKFSKFGINKSEYEVDQDKGSSWNPKSLYMGEDPSEGGYVYAEPGVYFNVAVLDIASMHPSSLILMDYFGPYTKGYADLKQARIYIKHKEYDKVKDLFDGRLVPYLSDPADSKNLANALKIILNSVYGLSSAPFANKFKHPSNIDNIVAKRGSLFMITLKHKVQEMGYTVAHIKTDSIKIPNADKKIIDFVIDFGKQYGYDFEHEHTYNRMALVNKSTIIAMTEDGEWEAVGAEFQNPYVYKTLFTCEELDRNDFFITKQVKDASIYFGNVEEGKDLDISNFEFNGSIARFYASKTGTDVIRYSSDTNKYSFVSGTKGFKWKSAREFSGLDDIDMDYYHKLAIDAVKHINEVGESASIVECRHEFIKEELKNFEDF